MIFDIHAHIAYHKLYAIDFLKSIIPEFNNFTREQFSMVIKRFLNDDGCVKLKKQMELSGIQKAALLMIDPGIENHAELRIEEIYEYHYQILKNNQDHFIVFAGIDPRRGLKGMKLVEKAITTYGFRGLKLYPPTGFALTDENLKIYFNLCKAFQIPVMIHINPEHEISDDQKYYNELYQIIGQNRKIVFILAHTGYRLNNENVKMLLNLPNCFLDISGFQKYKDNNHYTIINSMRCHHKILFGTDWPLFHSMRSIMDDIVLIKEKLIPVLEPGKMVDEILYSNSMRMFTDLKIL